MNTYDDIEIRLATHADLTGLMVLEQAFPDGERDTEDAYAAQIERPTSVFMVAIAASCVVGHLILERWPTEWRDAVATYQLGDEMGDPEGSVAFVESICVAESVRRRGVARRLMAVGLAQFGHCDLVLGAIRTNNEPALRHAREQGRTTVLVRDHYFPLKPAQQVAFMARLAS